MAILFDFGCAVCGNIEEIYIKHPEELTPDVLVPCPVCKSQMRKVFISPPHYQPINNQDAKHIRDAAIAFDPEDERPEVQTFLKDKTRDNLKTAMKTAGIRHSEISISGHGEEYDNRMERKKAEKNNVKERTESIMKKRRENRTITLR